MATTYLTRTPASAGNRDKWSWSAWIKKTTTGVDQVLFSAYSDASNYTEIRFDSVNDNLQFRQQIAGAFAGRQHTNRKFRDTSAWYHIVIVYDSGNATASDRMKMYVNGVEETSFNVYDHVSINVDSWINNNISNRIGTFNTSNYWNGSMSHINFIDGTAYDASAFGEFDANGVWTINTAPSVTYGTNGFFILKNGNSVTDQSGEGNNFTVGGGTLTNTEDSPSNVFAVINALENYNSSFTLSEGNLKAVTANYSFIRSTIGASSGKWYMEIKCTAQTSNTNKWSFGISDAPASSNAQCLGDNNYEYTWRGDANIIFYNGSNTIYGSDGGMSTGMIVGIALDLDNNKIYWSRDGTWRNSADPSAGTNGFSIVAPSSTNNGFYHFAFGECDGGNNFTFETNFGNGYFGTTAVASAGTNASGNGIFEYDVPTGFTSLSTKGLNL